MSCPKGKILRKAYTRKAYTRKDGTRVKKTRIAAKCIKDTGNPGKGPKKIGKLNKGTLTQFGYHTNKNATARRKAISKAIKKYGRTPIIRKLNVLYVFNKNKAPGTAAKARADMFWTQKQKR